MSDLITTLQKLGDTEHDDLSVAYDALAEIVRLRILTSEQQDEIERLTAALKIANANHEHFERHWYLRGDEIERLRAELADEAAIRSRMAEANNALRAEVEALRAERDVLKTGICIDPDEWPVLRRAINRMVRIAREQDHAEAR